ncbi:MAG TPA: heparan-alpha-glucosaminide N-acetyltransferase domain-containing protein, partial [Gemmatimonadaceae bacterium]|nr:heparan-alpha-glucosaminide N-acetyltransferase domain-containing protein [Gemmatimonadaceae bacterium]
LWALGWSMILMALLIRVPRMLVAIFTGALIFGHNLFDGVRPEAWGFLAPLWQLLHVPGFVIPNVLFVGYPLIPWVAVMSLGFLLAELYVREGENRRKFLVYAGVGAITLFVALRATNGYGNAVPWTEQRTNALTVASFLNVMKYPPSLQYLLMTIGPVLIGLALTERARGPIARFFEVYGRVPLFYYVGHIFVAHLVAMGLALIQSGELRRVPIIHNPAAIPESHGVELPGVYLGWAIVVAIMYSPCVRFARLKATRGEWWIRYM